MAYLPTDFTVCFLVCLILVVILLVSNGQLLLVLTGCLKGLPSMTVLCDRFALLPRGTPYNGLYGEAPTGRGTFFRPQVYKRVVILLIEVCERLGKSVIWVCERA